MANDEGKRDFFAALSEAFGAGTRRAEPMARHTSYRIGGPADYFVVVERAADLAHAVRLAVAYGVPYFVLGAGTNILVADGGVRGLVIHNRCRAHELLPDGDELGAGPAVVAESGVLMPHLAAATAAAGYAGLEWAVGVPGTVGGAVLGNAGAWGGSVAAYLRQVELLTASGEVARLGPDEMGYTYRSSRLKRASGQVVRGGGEVVLRASFALRPGDPAALQEAVARLRRERLARQPAEASAGSVFKNPPGDYAGRLIEAAGLKGRRCGQAEISAKHANFFVNLGGARAADVMALVDLARARVKQLFGVDLELEVQLVGDW